MRLEKDLVIRRSRPTMISAKYRAREERRRLMKISANKLKRIEDPETSLCRSVLINNAVRRLQRENRDEKTRNLNLPVVSYLHGSSKENNISRNILIDVVDSNISPRKRLSDNERSENSKRQKSSDIALQEDVFSDFYILPSSPRLLPHFDNIAEAQTSDYRPIEMFDNRLGMETYNTNYNTVYSTHNTSLDNTVFTPLNNSPRNNTVDLMEMNEIDSERICGYARFTDSSKSLEEHLAELQTLDEQFDLAKFERNNNQSCGRAFHDIQTFHSLVPGLET